MLEIRPLSTDELALAGARLPLSRLDHPNGEYLVAWRGSEPVGHARLDWGVDPPELQDVFVLKASRRKGIGSALCAAAEHHVARRNERRLSLEVGEQDHRAQALYEKLGYRRTSDAPRRIYGTIELRGGSIEVDDTLIRLEKSL